MKDNDAIDIELNLITAAMKIAADNPTVWYLIAAFNKLHGYGAYQKLCPGHPLKFNAGNIDPETAMATIVEMATARGQVLDE